MSGNGHFLLAASSGQAIEIHAYFQALRLLDVSSPDPTVRPHASFKLEYAERSKHDGYEEWETFHPRGGYARRRTTAHSTSVLRDPDSNDLQCHLSTVEWLEVDELLEQVRAHGPGANLPRQRRNLYKIHNLAESIDGSLLWRTSTRGYHSCWVEDDGDEWRVRFLPILCPDSGPDLERDVSEGSRSLKLPIDPMLVEKLLTFCDDTATLAVLTEDCDEGCCPRGMRMFRY